MYILAKWILVVGARSDHVELISVDKKRRPVPKCLRWAQKNVRKDTILL